MVERSEPLDVLQAEEVKQIDPKDNDGYVSPRVEGRPKELDNRSLVFGGDDSENSDDEIDQNLGDRTLAMTVREAIVANCHIDGLQMKLVESLEHNQERFREEGKRIKELQKALPRQPEGEHKQFIQRRLNAALKKQSLIGQSIVTSRRQLRSLIEGSQEFKDRFDEFITEVAIKKQNLAWMPAEMRDIAEGRTEEEEMAEIEADIDLQIRKLDMIEKADYSIRPQVESDLEIDPKLQGIFTELDKILGKFPQALAEGENPYYYPKHGVFLDDI